MTVFESGILSKMTEYEYEKLGKQQSEEHKDKINFQNKQKEAKEKQKQEKNDKLQPINIKMVQGSFYILIIGYGVSGRCNIVKHIFGLYLKLYTFRNSFVFRNMAPSICKNKEIKKEK